MVATYRLVLFAVPTLLYAGVVGGLWLFYRAVERRASFDSPERRRWAGRSFAAGALLAFVGFEFLVALFVFDLALGVLDRGTLLYVGVGIVVASAVPLGAGLVVGLSAAE